MTGYHCWVWLVEEADGTVGPVAAVLPGLGLSVLQSRRRELAEAMRGLAERHARTSGRPVRLAHLVEEETAP